MRPLDKAFDQIRKQSPTLLMSIRQEGVSEWLVVKDVHGWPPTASGELCQIRYCYALESYVINWSDDRARTHRPGQRKSNLLQHRKSAYDVGRLIVSRRVTAKRLYRDAEAAAMREDASMKNK